MSDSHPAVVAIGSSADGIHALRAIVRGLGATMPAAVVIVQHRTASRPSMLGALLARATPLTVKDVVHGDALCDGTVYIAPPGIHVVLADGTLKLEAGEKVAYSRPSIDVLFDSVARVCGSRAIGVLLGGAGRDGARGLAAIRKAGGQTLVQDPSDARYPGMPAAALALDGHAVLPLGEIGPEITRLVRTLAAGETSRP
jgi:two-component system, chemotaxis family, protein-glutamate methylesterase/glutaminase